MTTMNMHLNRMTAMAFVLITTLAFTSCDDDIDVAYDLNGIWQGTIEGNYYYDRYGNNEGWDTEIEFVQHGDFASGGYGYEVDYSWRTGRGYSSSFNWEVRNGRIHMLYDDGYHIVVRDYEFYYVGNGQRFRGYFDDYDTGETLASFNLVKVSGWSNWAKEHTMNFEDGHRTD